MSQVNSTHQDARVQPGHSPWVEEAANQHENLVQTVQDQGTQNDPRDALQNLMQNAQGYEDLLANTNFAQAQQGDLYAPSSQPYGTSGEIGIEAQTQASWEALGMDPKNLKSNSSWNDFLGSMMNWLPDSFHELPEGMQHMILIMAFMMHKLQNRIQGMMETLADSPGGDELTTALLRDSVDKLAQMTQMLSNMLKRSDESIRASSRNIRG